MQTVSNNIDQDYSTLERIIAERIATAKGPLFTTNATGLFEAYLAGIPAEHQQHYNCNHCRCFVERYGWLVTIDADGTTVPLLWPSLGGPMASTPLWMLVSKAKVTGVFYSSEATWGTPYNIPGKGSKFEGKVWTHLHGKPSSVYSSALKTASQEMAEKLEDYKLLRRTLAETPQEAVVQAIRVLEADVVDRPEKAIAAAKWFLELYGKNTNQIWLAVAQAPPGWCHVRNKMLGTLLDDVIAGLPFEEIKRRWNEKMHPLQYQRPAAPPSDGQITAANRVMEKLKSSGALARRFAQLDEIQALWRPMPQPEEPKTGGTFDHLRQKPQGVKPVELPPKSVKFDDLQLQHAHTLEVLVPVHGPFFGMVTAVNPDAPNILQWDHPISWYFWHGGSAATQWGIVQGWHKVDAVCEKPCHWRQEMNHHGRAIFFIISTMRESRPAHGGFFPECLRAEYHGIRSVMEAHAHNAVVEDAEHGSANGISLDGNQLTVRVNGVDTYVVTL